MNKKGDTGRQRELPFEGAAVWERLPEEARERVIQILAEILQGHFAQVEARINE